MLRIIFLLIISIILNQQAIGQKIPFPHRADNTNHPALTNEMKNLAEKVLKIYQNKQKKNNQKQQLYYHNLAMLQMAGLDYANARVSLKKAQANYKGNNPYFEALCWMPHQLLTQTKISVQKTGTGFNPTLQQIFEQAYSQLDDKTTPWVQTYVTKDVSTLQRNFQKQLVQQKGIDSINFRTALWLCRNYVDYRVYQSIVPIVEPILAAKEAQQLIFQDSVMIKTPEGHYISTVVARKKGISTPQPTILFFNIYAEGKIDHYNFRIAKEAAKRGYVGVVAFPRGKRYSSGKTIPYENDHKDTYTVIDWISKQKWSNGKVGMYGGSYCGFTQWAATKKLHPALKTIVPAAAVAPGIDVPMENNVYMNFVYSWIPYVTNKHYLDYDVYSDRTRWNRLQQNWFKKGTPYKNLDKIDGTANPTFQRWIKHPDYDAYWQAMIPYQEEFAKINIPILNISGYYDGGQISALYYLKQHYKYRKNAQHYFLIGPWGHFGCQGFPDAKIGGYTIDPVANLNIHEVIYQWFDYTLKGRQKPSILKNKINYQVMGGNEWKHAPSFYSLGNDTLRFYLSHQLSSTSFESTYDGKHKFYELSPKVPKNQGHINQVVDFTKRNPADQNNYFTPDVINQKLTLSNGIAFATQPFKGSLIISGTYSMLLQTTINKKDMDCSIVLYEQTPNGQFFKLTNRYIGRASYAKSNCKRTLLTPGKKQTIPVTNTRMTARKISKGSRLVVVLNVNKHPFEQINYGTGKDVSTESMKDAKTPLKIKWHNDGYIQIPVIKD